MLIAAQILMSFGTFRPGDLALDVEEATALAWQAKGLARVVYAVDPAEAVEMTYGESTSTGDAKPSRRASRSKTGNGGGDAALPAAGGEQG